MTIQTQLFPVAATFGVAAPDSLSVEGFADALHPAIPTSDPDYIFRNDHLRDVLAFLANPCGDGLYISGPTGAGKTSLVCQVAARLNWPVQQVTCHGRLELHDLVGQFVLAAGGSMVFVHGPLATAVRDGQVLILNEIDLMEPSELAGLNGILEGAPLLIPQNGGEIIKPHPKFRLAVTGNSAGMGDQTGLYQGVLQQNIALLDRFRLMAVGYPEPAIEKAILAKALTRVGVAMDPVMDAITDKMIELANAVRKLFIGDGPDGMGQLSVTLSTRTLVRWANLMVTFKRAPNALAYSLDRALTLRAEPVQREAIQRLAQDIFGDVWG